MARFESTVGGSGRSMWNANGGVHRSDPPTRSSAHPPDAAFAASPFPEPPVLGRLAAKARIEPPATTPNSHPRRVGGLCDVLPPLPPAGSEHPVGIIPRSPISGFFAVRWIIGCTGRRPPVTQVVRTTMRSSDACGKPAGSNGPILRGCESGLSGDRYRQRRILHPSLLPRILPAASGCRPQCLANHEIPDAARRRLASAGC
jgi:hypothetical protein